MIQNLKKSAISEGVRSLPGGFKEALGPKNMFCWVLGDLKVFLNRFLIEKQKMIFGPKNQFFIEISDPPGPFTTIVLSPFWVNCVTLGLSTALGNYF